MNGVNYVSLEHEGHEHNNENHQTEKLSSYVSQIRNAAAYSKPNSSFAHQVLLRNNTARVGTDFDESSCDSTSRYSSYGTTTGWQQSSSSSKTHGVSAKDLDPNTIYSISWVRDEEVACCMACQKNFSFTKRRHHCRCCGQVVCFNCSRSKRQVVGLVGMHRVCTECLSNGVWTSSTTTSNQQPESFFTLAHTFATTDDEVQVVKERLVEFYETYAPEKVHKVDYIIQKYVNNLDKMFEALERKYCKALLVHSSNEQEEEFMSDNQKEEDDVIVDVYVSNQSEEENNLKDPEENVIIINEGEGEIVLDDVNLSEKQVEQQQSKETLGTSCPNHTAEEEFMMVTTCCSGADACVIL